MKRHLTYIAFFAFAISTFAHAQTETALYIFGSQTNDGNYADAGLIFDANGNLYGTTVSGGAYYGGTVFELTAAGSEKILYSFGSHSGDGGVPYAGVILDNVGNLYGTTAYGGAYRCSNAYVCGTVFEVTAEGTEKVLHSFGGGYGEKADGTYPQAGLIFDNAGNLYGTTSFGGDLECGGYGCGTVFKLTPKGKKNVSYKEKVLYRFGRYQGDGQAPYAGLIFDNAGNLYGTAFDGGYYGYGAVFELTAAGKEKVLYSFGRYKGDGLHPGAGLIFDSDGNLYSTTTYGGANNVGTVFELTADGTEKILYNFGSQTGDGEYPVGGVIFDTNGNLYGTTYFGGAYYDGTVFELTAAGTEKILYTFGSQTGDGIYPYATPIFDNNGNLYGTTPHGGDFECEAPYGCGTVFKLTP
ncbi:MAG: choice-of-anchor tandem repeat GloVer-containing protein [Terriglobales bacterium]